MSNSPSTRSVFLSHASVDKDAYVRPFAAECDARQITYWLDEAEIEWGDRITDRINDGLKRSEFVVIFLSDAFVGRNWTNAELSAALNKENTEGRKVVLPVIIGNATELLEHYPLLRDKSYLHWDIGIKRIADELQQLKDRAWTKEELNKFILDHIDLECFPKKDLWGDKHRFLAHQSQSDGEGPYYFWNEEENTVERYWLTAIRNLGLEPLAKEDIQFIRSVVMPHRKTAR